MKTNIKYSREGLKKAYREVFDVEENKARLRIYVKSSLTVFDVVSVSEARLEREEFCASKFTFTLLKDPVISFNQGDAVTVKYDSKIIFAGYVFTKSRDREGLIDVICYDSMRYLKNRRSYTRGRMSLEEVVRGIASENGFPMGEIAKAEEMLMPIACENVSLLDTVVKACRDAEKISGRRYIVYDDGGCITLKDEAELVTDIQIDSSCAENFVYKDTIDEGVYNTIELYQDAKKLNLRTIEIKSDEDKVRQWGRLILSKRATGENAEEEARRLLEQYSRINRKIVIKGVKGDVRFMPGAGVYVKLTMGDIALDGLVRCRKTVHRFKDNLYFTDLYIDGSEL